MVEDAELFGENQHSLEHSRVVSDISGAPQRQLTQPGQREQSEHDLGIDFEALREAKAHENIGFSRRAKDQQGEKKGPIRQRDLNLLL